MRRWFVIALAVGLSAFLPGIITSAAPEQAVSAITRSTIIAIAKEMVYGQWVSPVTVYRDRSASPIRWGTWYKGQTYTGMAYTQNNPQEGWATFKSNMDRGIGKPGVDQGTDCSGFASFAWQIPRQTTWTFIPNGYAYKLSSLSSLLPGDGLLRVYDHIGLFYERLDNGNIVVLHQTTPSARKEEWSYAYASSYTPVRRSNITSTTTTPPATTQLGQFSVQYFTNENLEGSPVLTKVDSYPLEKDWGGGGPGSGVPNDHFSLRAEGEFYFDATQNYTFNVTSDDGVRVYIDGKLVEDHWTVHAPASYRDEYYLTAGKHKVTLEYFERDGGAMVSLRWWKTRTCANGEFLGEFFSNPDLGGAPAWRNCSSTLNYNWGLESPTSGMSGDLFSARWEGKFSFQARAYTFIARADDGVRVWIDDVLIIDQWRDQAPTEYRVTRNMSAGTHTVLVRYYERGGGAVATLRWQ